jgi:thioesterase domain-containing protein
VEADPEGPYLLGGFCIDGYVAFEIAQILKAEGRDVRLVAVVERDGPDVLFKRLRVVTEFARYHFRTLAGSTLAEKGRYIGERLGRLPKTAARLIRRERGAAPDEHETATLTDTELHSRRAFAARGSYRPQGAYPGRVDIYFAAETHAAIPTRLFPHCGWDRTVTGPKHVHVVPGDHDSINTEPDLATLAHAVRKSVDAVL